MDNDNHQNQHYRSLSKVISVTILGATGSIGQNTLELIALHNNRFSLLAVTAGQNVKQLIDIIYKYKPQYAAILNCTNEEYEQLKCVAAENNVTFGVGEQAILDICQLETDIAISAIVGLSALKPTYEIIKHCKTLGLANKESLICAGPIFIEHAKKHSVKILPIDSEHNSLFQMLDLLASNIIPTKLTITASGGPFLHLPLEEFKNITPKQAIKHPNWNMGVKISVDSATLANKGLELIETHFLFNFAPCNIDAVIHPESIIHAMVDFIDGSSQAVLYQPHMKIPISHVLGYPERIESGRSPLDLLKIKSMNFYEIDYSRFPMYKLAKDVLLSLDQSKMITYNCANELAVHRFLQGYIKFTQIADIVNLMLDQTQSTPIMTIEDVVAYQDEIKMIEGDEQSKISLVV